MNALSPSNSWSSWVRMFDIPDVSKHKNGFTIYKVVSFVSHIQYTLLQESLDWYVF